MIAVPMTVAATGETVPVSVGVKIEIGAEPYHGSYEFTPTDQEQVVPTADKVLGYDIVIHPIPSNYGQISWDGSIITVS